jgi:hypothetical protein
MDVPLPPVTLPASPAAFVIVAVSMLAITIFLLGKVLPPDGQPPLVTQMILALSVIAGGSVLLLSLLFVFVSSNGATAWTWVLLSFNFMMMAPAGLWFVSLILFRDRRVDPNSWTWPGLIALATTGSEVVMGVLFVYGGAATPLPVLTTFALGLTSVWFLWSMASVMTALLLWAPLSHLERWALFALTLSALVAPWVTAFPTVGGALMAALMAALFVLLVRRLGRGAGRTEEMSVLFGLAAAFLAMTASGLAVALSGGSSVAVLIFGGTMAFVMGVESAYLLRRFYHGPRFVARFPRRPDEEPSINRRAPGPLSSGDPGAWANR